MALPHDSSAEIIESENGETFLAVKDLSVETAFNGRTEPVLRNLDLIAARGEFVALVGPSGCGKTTLFNALAGLVPRQSGQLLLEGRPVDNLLGRVAYMQQKDLLLPWRTTLDNAILGLELKGVSRKTAHHQALELLDDFGLRGFDRHFPDQLSGGMRQRAALLRTILCNKNILLLDEPFGALDAITRRDLQVWLLKVWAGRGDTVLLVTHDVEEALVLADRVYVLTRMPATAKAVLDVPMDRPRDITAPESIDLKRRLLALLDEERALPNEG